MTDGLIHVKGNAGNFVGAACDAGRSGQNGGAILIEGSAGGRVGSSMRRGLIAIGGDAGNGCGYTMNAGTIVVFGKVQERVGLEMTRGTILLMQEPTSEFAGFIDGGQHPMPVANLIDDYLSETGFSKLIGQRLFRLLHGDMIRGGRGEVLIVA